MKCGHDNGRMEEAYWIESDVFDFIHGVIQFVAWTIAKRSRVLSGPLR
jgi:hypothetical protein